MWGKRGQIEEEIMIRKKRKADWGSQLRTNGMSRRCNRNLSSSWGRKGERKWWLCFVLVVCAVRGSSRVGVSSVVEIKVRDTGTGFQPATSSLDTHRIVIVLVPLARWRLASQSDRSERNASCWMDGIKRFIWSARWWLIDWLIDWLRVKKGSRRGTVCAQWQLRGGEEDAGQYQIQRPKKKDVSIPFMGLSSGE